MLQRFGSALNLDIHFRMLVLDGAYLADAEPPVFRRIAGARASMGAVMVMSAVVSD